MIKSIYLENWKTHQKSYLEFNLGSNIIIGKIGAGKSSIVDAICYSLFGKFPSISNKKISTSEVIMFKPVKKKSAFLKLEFMINENLYRVEREIYLEKTNQARLYLNDRLIAGPKRKDVDNKISELLSIDYNLFTKIVYSEQNELDYFLKIPPSKRKDKFDELFGIIQLEDMKEDTRKLKRELEIELNKQDALEQQLSSQLSSIDINKLKTTITEVTNKKNKIIDENKDLVKSKEKQFEILNLLKKRKSEFENKNLKLNILNSKLEDITSKLNMLEEKNYIKEYSANIKEAINLKNELISKKEKDYKSKLEDNKKLEINYNSLLHKLNFYKEQKEKLELKEKNLNSRLFQYEFSLDDLIKNKEVVLEHLNKIKQEKLRLLNIFSEVKKAIIELSKGFARCPVCDSILSKDQISEKLRIKSKLREEIEVKLKNINQEITLKEKELKEIENIEVKLNENKRIKKEIQNLRKSISENNKELNNLEIKLKNIPRSVNLKPLEIELESLKKELNDLVNYSELITSKEKLEINLKLILEDIKKTPFNEEEYLSILSSFKNIEYKIKETESKIKLYNDLLSENKKQILSYENLIVKRKEIQGMKEKLFLRKQDLSYFLRSLENTQFQLRKVLIDNINQALYIIWPKLYPYRDFISARMQASKDYILEVQTLEREWIRVEGLLSGGERSCAALSIRIAIALILTKKLGLLILDEPTHNLDEKSVESLSNILDKQLPELINQTFIITHDNKLLETVNASKYVVDKDKENDGISIIRKV